jgi:phosphate/sulfate permease
MRNSGAWLVVAAIGAFAVAAGLAFSLVAPTWDQGETSALLAGIVACPTLGMVIGAIFLGLHWRDERQAARRERETARRQRTVERQTQDAQGFNANAFVMRQTLDLLGQVAQVQARQAAAGLQDLKREAFASRAIIDAPAQEEPWFMGEWDYGDETTANDQTAGGVRYL